MGFFKAADAAGTYSLPRFFQIIFPSVFCVREKRFAKRKIVPRSLSRSLGLGRAQVFLTWDSEGTFADRTIYAASSEAE
jgi:hypothetical protein